MIKITRNNIYCKITGLLDPNVIIKLDQALSYRLNGYMFLPSYRRGTWDGRNRLFRKRSNGYFFLSGFFSKVEVILKSNYQDYEIIDERKEVKFGKKIKTKNIETREYQQRILEACLKEKSGVVAAATGSGKSISILQLIANTNVKTIIYVIGVDLLYQLHQTIENTLGIKIGIIGDGKVDIKRKINICTIWTAATALGKKYVPLNDEDASKKEKLKNENKSKIVKAIREAEMVLYDECQMIACRTIQEINSESIGAYYKFGFSGSPWRDSGDDLLIEVVVGKNIIEVTSSELIKKGFLVEPIIHFIAVPKMDKLSDNYQSIYKQYVVDNEVRNELIIKATNKLIDSGRKILILVKNIKHGKILLNELEQNSVVYFLRGEISSEERNQVKEDFINGNIDIIIATAIYDMGIDIKNLDALVLCGSGKSSVRTIQRLGRVLRPYPGKKNAIVIDMLDNCKYLTQHAIKRLETYRTEAGFKIKLPKRKDVSNGSSKKTKKKKKGERLSPKKPTGKMSW